MIQPRESFIIINMDQPNITPNEKEKKRNPITNTHVQSNKAIFLIYTRFDGIFSIAVKLLILLYEFVNVFGFDLMLF